MLLHPAGPVLCHLSVWDGILGGNLFFLRLLFFLFLLFSPSPFFLFLQLLLSVGSGLITPAPQDTFLISCHLFDVFFFLLKPPHSGDLLSISMLLLFLFLFLYYAFCLSNIAYSVLARTKPAFRFKQSDGRDIMHSVNVRLYAWLTIYWCLPPPFFLPAYICSPSHICGHAACGSGP